MKRASSASNYVSRNKLRRICCHGHHRAGNRPHKAPSWQDGKRVKAISEKPCTQPASDRNLPVPFRPKTTHGLSAQFLGRALYSGAQYFVAPGSVEPIARPGQGPHSRNTGEGSHRFVEARHAKVTSYGHQAERAIATRASRIGQAYRFNPGTPTCVRTNPSPRRRFVMQADEWFSLAICKHFLLKCFSPPTS